MAFQKLVQRVNLMRNRRPLVRAIAPPIMTQARDRCVRQLWQEKRQQAGEQHEQRARERHDGGR
jgi:hypothetical protein